MTHDAQPEVVIIAVAKIATIARITNDETVENIYEAPGIENDIREQRHFDGVGDKFEKNQDAEVVDEKVVYLRKVVKVEPYYLRGD